MNERAPTRNDRKFFCEMTKSELTEFARKVGTLETGDTYERIVQVLGKPTLDRENWTKGSKGRFISRNLLYYTRKRTERGVNLKHDRYVAMKLDQRGILYEWFSTQEGIPTRPPDTPAQNSVRDSE